MTPKKAKLIQSLVAGLMACISLFVWRYFFGVEVLRKSNVAGQGFPLPQSEHRGIAAIAFVFFSLLSVYLTLRAHFLAKPPAA